MVRIAPLALLLLAACMVPVRTVVPPEELAQRRPENQSGLLVEDELVRLTWSPFYKGDWRAFGPASFDGFANSRSSDGFFPLLLASKAVNGQALFTFDGGAPQWRDGLIDDQDGLRQALREARDGAAFRTPVRASLGGAELWAVCDLLPVTGPSRDDGQGVPASEYLATLELHRGDPRLTSDREARPLMVQFVARRPAKGEEVRRDLATLGIFAGEKGYFRINRLDRTPEGRLTAIEFTPWRPDLRAVIGGQTADTVPGGFDGGASRLEQVLTDALIEWKTRDLPAWLRAAAPAKLDEAIIEAEKGMLQLDLKSRLVKDQVDTGARQGAGAQPELIEKAQLIDQRKAIVGAVLGSFKAARAQAR